MCAVANGPSVEYLRGQHTHRVRLTGEIDMVLVDQLTETAERIAGSGATDIDVEVDQVTFMDSTGLAFLARLHGVCDRAGGKMTLIGPDPQLTRLFELVGFAAAFTIVPKG